MKYDMVQDFPQRNADTVVVLDFETSGLSPNRGDRAIEIGAVRIENGKITERFQQLMDPGIRISPFLENFTGITNKMLRQAPPCDEVMNKFADFVDGHNLVAHNASFDKRFLDAELNRINRKYAGRFACSMLVSRRVYPDISRHTLGNLVRFKGIPQSGAFHRALSDSEMTAKLWLIMLSEISEKYKISPLSFVLMQQLAKQNKRTVHDFLQRQRGSVKI